MLTYKSAQQSRLHFHKPFREKLTKSHVKTKLHESGKR